ncbi:hypothetical protein ACOSQ4_022559 [Xanthoceras sorbifolium]
MASEDFIVVGEEIGVKKDSTVVNGIKAPITGNPNCSSTLHESRWGIECDTVHSHEPSPVAILHAEECDDLLISNKQVVTATNSGVEELQLILEQVIANKDKAKATASSSASKGKDVTDSVGNDVMM